MMFPKNVMIDNTLYAIEFTSEPILVDNRVCYGSIDYIAAVIQIKEDMPLQRKRVTLLHEIVHGMIFERRIDFKRLDEEDIVESFAHAWYSLIQDNPMLLAFIATLPNGSVQLIGCDWAKRSGSAEEEEALPLQSS